MKQNRFWLLELATMSIMGKTFNLSRVMEDFGLSIYSLYWFPRWYSANESTANAGNAGDQFWFQVGKIPWVRNGYPLQYSCMENPMDIEA